MYNVEIQAINQILKNKSLEIINKEGIEPSYFLSNQEQINFILDHKRQYGVVPDVLNPVAAFIEILRDIITVQMIIWIRCCIVSPVWIR